MLRNKLTINVFWANEHAGVKHKHSFCDAPIERTLPLLVRRHFALMLALGLLLKRLLKANWGDVNPWPGERIGLLHLFVVILLFDYIPLQITKVSSRTLFDPV